MIVIWNGFMTKITGYTPQEALGKNLVETFIDESNKDSVRAVLTETLATGEGKARYEFPLYTKDKRKRIIWLSASAKQDQHGNIIGVQGIGNDVTEAIWRADELNRFVATANAPVI